MTQQLDFFAPLPPSDIDAALKARDKALQQVNDNADEWAKSVVDRIVTSLAESGEPFTADDARDLIPPGVSPHLLSARLNSARMRGLIVKIGERPSRLVSIHGKPIAVWVAS